MEENPNSIYKCIYHLRNPKTTLNLGFCGLYELGSIEIREGLYKNKTCIIHREVPDSSHIPE